MMTKIEENIRKTAEKLKRDKIVETPEWAKYVKTGSGRDRVPEQDDWWYLRAASILRKINFEGPIGSERLSKAYGGRKNRGYKSEKFKKGSRKIIRVILQQLENGELVKKSETLKKGRTITEKGTSFLK